MDPDRAPLDGGLVQPAGRRSEATGPATPADRQVAAHIKEVIEEFV